MEIGNNDFGEPLEDIPTPEEDQDTPTSEPPKALPVKEISELGPARDIGTDEEHMKKMEIENNDFGEPLEDIPTPDEDQDTPTSEPPKALPEKEISELGPARDIGTDEEHMKKIKIE